MPGLCGFVHIHVVVLICKLEMLGFLPQGHPCNINWIGISVYSPVIMRSTGKGGRVNPKLRGGGGGGGGRQQYGKGANVAPAPSMKAYVVAML